MSTFNEIDAKGTIFENCPATIPNISVTFLLNSSIPLSKKCIYQSGSNASVALFTIGEGYIVYLRYDFFDAGPGYSQAISLWTEYLLDSGTAAATFGPSSVAPVAIPTLSEWGFILLSLFILIVDVVSVRQRYNSIGSFNA